MRARGNDHDGFELWRSDNGTNWSQVFTNGFGDSNNKAIWTFALVPYNGYLYAGTQNYSTGEVWRSEDGAAWDQVNTNGFGDVDNGIAAALQNLTICCTSELTTRIMERKSGAALTAPPGPGQIPMALATQTAITSGH